MDFKPLITKDLNEKFYCIRYNELELIIMRENNYINATKLCKLRGREFKNWMRLSESTKLIEEIDKINRIWKTDSDDTFTEVIIKVNLGGRNTLDKIISGSYVHQDLVPYITSWISPLFTVKVSKIINCYVSNRYAFKFKEEKVPLPNNEEVPLPNKEETLPNKELLKLLQEFNTKYDRDALELKESYRDLKNHNKRMEDKDVLELKESYRELKNHNKRVEDKYDKDILELKESYRDIKNHNKRVEDKYDKDILELKESYRDIKNHNKRVEDKYDKDILELKESYRDIKNHNKRVEDKYDKDILELKESYRDIKNHNKRVDDKYDKDVLELKESYIEIKNHNKLVEDKYDKYTQELKLELTEVKNELKKLEKCLQNKMINSFHNKLYRLVVLQNKRDLDAFNALRAQAERLNQEASSHKNEYKVLPQKMKSQMHLSRTKLTPYPVSTT
uniref:KilA N domain protein n=1 Tax=Condorpox virus TaxID=3049970 RepID=A0AAT9UR33_9POXV